MYHCLPIETGFEGVQEMAGMIQKYKFVEQNIKMLRKLTKEGYISTKLLVNYNIYKTYMTTKGNYMERYKMVATEMNTSSRTVRRAVKDMKEYVSD